LPVLRYDVPAPCETCPRGGPQNERRYRLSERNYAAFSLWAKLRATRGAYQLDQKIASCPLFAENMSLVEQAVESGRAAAKVDAMERAKSHKPSGD
jgi:hypothetical protein